MKKGNSLKRFSFSEKRVNRYLLPDYSVLARRVFLALCHSVRALLKTMQSRQLTVVTGSSLPSVTGPFTPPSLPSRWEPVKL